MKKQKSITRHKVKQRKTQENKQGQHKNYGKAKKPNETQDETNENMMKQKTQQESR